MPQDVELMLGKLDGPALLESVKKILETATEARILTQALYVVCNWAAGPVTIKDALMVNCLFSMLHA